VRGRLRNRSERRAILRKADLIVQDAYGVRFVLYAWNEPFLLRLVRRDYDRAQLLAVPRLVRRGATIFDVGANIGSYSVFLSRLCGPGGVVFAFEPVPDTFGILKETLALNRCDNVVPIEKALCERLGTTQMHLFEPQYSGWNTMRAYTTTTPEGGRVAPNKSVEVPTDTLDNFCAEHEIERIDFLKVDVEGFELSALVGARQLLGDKRIDYLCFEINQEALQGAGGVKSRDVFEALESHGYACYQFDVPSEKFQGPIHDTSEVWANFYASWRGL
jgi:FkbM family methyltransferase